jgi:ribosomal protein S18
LVKKRGSRRPRQDAAAGDKQGGQRRGLFRRRKVCKFCADKIDDINYKDVKLLSGFVPERGKVLPRRISGTCAKHQRALRVPSSARGSSRCCRTRRTRPGASHGSHSSRPRGAPRPRGEIVKVADGYARNYLLPRKLALPATDAQPQAGRARAEDRRGARGRGARGAEAIAARLARSSSSIARKVGENDQLYGSVTNGDIAEALPPRASTSTVGRSCCPIRSRRWARARCR